MKIIYGVFVIYVFICVWITLASRSVEDAPMRYEFRDFVGAVWDIFAEKTNEITIGFPPLPKPRLEYLQEIYPYIAAIESDDSTEDYVTVTLATIFTPDEGLTIFDEATYESRIPRRLLGFQHLEWFVQNKANYPDFEKYIGKLTVDFNGLILVGQKGERFIPSLCENLDGWGMCFRMMEGSNNSGRVWVIAR